jgi:DNA-binding HxlR family transcriptional regulator
VRRTDRKSDCPINFTLERLGDPWSLLVIRDLMFKGKRTYSEFADSGERISTNILADRLRSLCSAGIIRKSGRGRSTRYSLTPKGIDLLPVLVEMILWGGRHDPGSGAPEAFLQRASGDRAGLLEELRAELIHEHGPRPLEAHEEGLHTRRHRRNG